MLYFPYMLITRSLLLAFMKTGMLMVTAFFDKRGIWVGNAIKILVFRWYSRGARDVRVYYNIEAIT